MSSSLTGFARCEHPRSRQKKRHRKSSKKKPHTQSAQSFDWMVRGYIPKGTLHVGDGWVGPRLSNEIRDDSSLKQTIRDAFRGLADQIEDAELEAYIERDREDATRTRVVLEVTTEINTIEEYKSIKETVRDVVRNAEQDDVMIYTRISRRH